MYSSANCMFRFSPLLLSSGTWTVCSKGWVTPGTLDRVLAGECFSFASSASLAKDGGRSRTHSCLFNQYASLNCSIVIWSRLEDKNIICILYNLILVDNFVPMYMYSTNVNCVCVCTCVCLSRVRALFLCLSHLAAFGFWRSLCFSEYPLGLQRFMYREVQWNCFIIVKHRCWGGEGDRGVYDHWIA